jgi:hypothetical protein
MLGAMRILHDLEKQLWFTFQEAARVKRMNVTNRALLSISRFDFRSRSRPLVLALRSDCILCG